MTGMSSIRVSGDKIEIINQLLLPHTSEWIEIKSIQEAHDAIKSMQVCRFSNEVQSSPLNDYGLIL